MGEEADITGYLKRLRNGDSSAEDELANAVYDRMLVLGRALLQANPAGYSLRPTALVNEVLLELLRLRSIDWNDRTHFYRTASRTMRRRIIDHIRRKRSSRNFPDASRVELDDIMSPPESRFEEILAVHHALDKLAELDAPLAELVEMTYFGGITLPAIAEIRQVSERTVMRHLSLAKAALRKFLGESCQSLANNNAEFLEGL